MDTVQALWKQEPGRRSPFVVACEPEMLEIASAVVEKIEVHRSSIGFLVVKAPDNLHEIWEAMVRSASATEALAASGSLDLLRRLPRRCVVVTISKSQARTLSWLGAVVGHRVVPFGVENEDKLAQLETRVWTSIRHLVDDDHSPSAALKSLWIGA